ncbi:MAG: hypothetical protein QHJ81_04645 [Anaerolineae bacterium]|nr:hypothetical protein [Anaerolineae bacterium]
MIGEPRALSHLERVAREDRGKTVGPGSRCGQEGD